VDSIIAYCPWTGFKTWFICVLRSLPCTERWLWNCSPSGTEIGLGARPDLSWKV